MALTSRDLYGRGVWSQLTREVDNMKQMDHPNIVKLYEVIDTETTLYLVMEYAAGGVCHCSRVSPSHSRVGLVTLVGGESLLCQHCGAPGRLKEVYCAGTDTVGLFSSSSWLQAKSLTTWSSTAG